MSVLGVVLVAAGLLGLGNRTLVEVVPWWASLVVIALGLASAALAPEDDEG